MNPEDAKAIKGEVSRAQQGFTRQSGTVESYRPYSGRGGIAVVLPDGPNAQSIEATNTTGVNLSPNDRVMLDFDPPAGVYVVGLVTSPALVSGSGEFCASFPGTLVSSTATLDSTRYYPPGPWTLTELRASFDGAQTGAVVFGVYVNAVLADTVTIASLANYGSATVSISGDDGDYLQWRYVSGANDGSLITLQGIGSGVSAGLDMLLTANG